MPVYIEEISVILPVRNREDIVVSALDSIKKQTYRPLHLILVDNNSTDATLDVLNAWKSRNEGEDFRVTVVEEAVPGACAARNRGAREAGSDKLMFFDSDDIMYPSLVETAVQAFVENPGTDIVVWRHVRRDLDGSTGKSHAPVHGFMETHLVHALLSTHSFMARRCVFEKAGWWNESLPAWNDYELGTRLLLATDRIVYVDKVLYEVVSTLDSITGTGFSSRAGDWERSLSAIERNIVCSARPDKERLLRIVAYRRIILAARYASEGSMDLAHKLKSSVFSDGRLNTLHRLMFGFAYHYTARGLRGAWLLLRRFI